jgi:hypothetical protein
LDQDPGNPMANAIAVRAGQPIRRAVVAPAAGGWFARRRSNRSGLSRDADERRIRPLERFLIWLRQMIPSGSKML